MLEGEEIRIRQSLQLTVLESKQNSRSVALGCFQLAEEEDIFLLSPFLVTSRISILAYNKDI